MAAGFGSRLGALTERIPKALVQVGDAPLVAHAVRFAQHTNPTEIIVVGGVKFDLVKAELERRALKVTIVENKDFTHGNLLTLLAARDKIQGDFLLMNVDHIYRPQIAKVVSGAFDEVTGMIDTDRQLGMDDMKVKRDAQGRIAQIAKTLTDFDCGYVGMTRVPQVAQARYWAAVAETQAKDGLAANVERVLARLAEGPTPPRVADISGHGWLEVDTPDERAAAEAVLAKGGWW